MSHYKPNFSEFLISDFKYLISDFKYLISDFKLYQVSKQHFISISSSDFLFLDS